MNISSLFLSVFLLSQYTIVCFITHINPQVNPDIIHILDDTNFDFFTQEGRNYQWIIIFVTDSCEYCISAREEVNEAFSLIYHDTIRFAEVRNKNNPLTITRFEVIGYPHIIMINNGRMWRYNKIVTKNNILEFISFNQKNNNKGISLPPKKRLYYLILFGIQDHLQIYKRMTEVILDFFNVKTDNLFPYQVIVFIQVILISFLLIEALLLWLGSKACLKVRDQCIQNDSNNDNNYEYEEGIDKE